VQQICDTLAEFKSTLPEEVLSQISLLVLLTPAEMKKSLANFEFEHPVPSTI